MKKIVRCILLLLVLGSAGLFSPAVSYALSHCDDLQGTYCPYSRTAQDCSWRNEDPGWCKCGASNTWMCVHITYE
jgi:hypothetical protein